MLHKWKLGRNNLILSLILGVITICWLVVLNQEINRTAPTSKQQNLSLADNQAQVNTLLLNTDQVTLLVNTGQTTIIAVLRDILGKPVAGAQVEFSTELGSIIPEIVITSADGIASTTFRAGTQHGQALISAHSQGISQNAVLQIRSSGNSELVNVLHLTINAEKLTSGQQAIVVATLLDPTGQPVKGEPITFFGSLGTVSPSSALSNENGEATATFVAGKFSGQATITVMAGYGSSTTTVHIEGSNPQPTQTPTMLPTITPQSQIFLPVVQGH